MDGNNGGFNDELREKKNRIDKIDPRYFDKFNGFYVLKRFEELSYLPEFLNIHNQVYKRFLKIFYLKGNLSNLSRKQVVDLCDLRLKYLCEITSLEYNKYIINILIKEIIKTLPERKNGKLKILDFGIGSGLSNDSIKELKLNDKLELIGTDISNNALRVCDCKGIDTFNWNDDYDNVSNDSFDGILSSFVFDFNITGNEITRLKNLLKKNRLLVLNMYKNDNKNYNNVIANIINAGFKVREKKIDVSNGKFNIMHTSEKILIAEKI